MSAHRDIAAMLTTLFMIGTVSFALTRSRIGLSMPFGSTRVFAFLVVAFGLCTSFVPLARVNPSVLGRSEWSGLDIALSVYRRSLPFSPVAFDIISTYLLLLCSVVVLCLSRPRKKLLMISALGIICSSWALEMEQFTLFDRFTRYGDMA